MNQGGNCPFGALQRSVVMAQEGIASVVQEIGRRVRIRVKDEVGELW